MSKPNVIWLTVESTRYDHTSLSDYHRDTTPNLRRRAERDDYQTHDHCITHGIWTQPSTTSMLTGTVPGRHGVGMFNEVVPAELSTVPELLGDVGYKTYCMATSAYVKSVGLDRGFDDFRHSLGAGSNLKKVFNYPGAFKAHFSDLLSDPAAVKTSGYKEGALSHMAVDNLKDIIKDGQQGEKPFFVYSHLQSPHQPYDPPAAELRSFTDDIDASASEALETTLDIYDGLETIRKHIAEGCQFSERTWESILTMYDAELRFMDRYIGDFLGWVDKQRIDDLIIVVTADHGDLFGERGVIAHKFLLHDGLIRVPLLLKGFDISLSKGDVVQHIDIMQRILERAGADTSQFQGVSLGDTLREYAFTQRKNWTQVLNEDFVKYNDDILDRPIHYGWTTAARTNEYKHVRSDDFDEFLTLPDESHDVSGDYPELISTFDTAISRFEGRYRDPIQTDEQQSLTQSMKQQLEYLGYR